jgi:hypothetical protein
VNERTRLRRLFVGWRDPATEAIYPEGLLVQTERDNRTRFTFRYLTQAAELERFQPFASFPELAATYESDRLFPLFMNRVMPRERSDYARYIERLDLMAEADPFAVLQRSGGTKATDRIEVFPEPEVDDATGRLRCIFFARGIDHVPGASELVAILRRGDRLTLVDDPNNTWNPRAMLLHEGSGRPVGYAPDYLVEFLHEVRNRCSDDVVVSVEHVNPPDTPSHLRLLCRVESCRPSGFTPFAEPRFQPLGSALEGVA